LSPLNVQMAPVTFRYFPGQFEPFGTENWGDG